jgi:RNA polymerase sigma-70 factor (ECF subfamily)
MTADESGITAGLLAAVAQGEGGALNKLLAFHRNYLRRIVDVRLDPQLRARIDPSDVVQETLLVASKRIHDFLSRQPTSFRLWLRRKALEQLIDQQRFHRRRKRNVAREIEINDPSSMAIADALISRSASQQLDCYELMQQVRAAMQDLSENDREILLLRHAEELTNAEAAEVMGIEPKAASARYGRAVLRLSTELRRQGIRQD